MITIRVGDNDEHRRLDRFLRHYFSGAPLSLIYRMIRKDVKVNGKRSSRETMLASGDEIVVYMSEEQARTLRTPKKVRSQGAKRQFSILYENDALLAVGKPYGLLTHGDRKEKKNTLVNQVEGYLMETGEYEPTRENTFRPAAVNRLDRNTTGIVLFGKTAPALRALGALMGDKEAVVKEYLTIAAGTVEDCLLTGWLSREEGSNTSRILAEDNGNAKYVETRVTCLVPEETASLLKVELLTGRTHQIRAQLAEAGHPLVGDPRYGDARINGKFKEKYGLAAQLLHCGRMSFRKEHIAEELKEFLPETGEILCPLPERFRKVAEDLFGTELGQIGNIGIGE